MSRHENWLAAAGPNDDCDNPTDFKYKITKTGRDYCYKTTSKFKTARGVVRAFETGAINGFMADNYEINGVNYKPNELTYEQRAQCLINNGFIIEI